MIMVSCIATLTGCTYLSPTEEQGTPLILAQGSSSSENPLELLEPPTWDSPELWVLVGHTRDIEQITAVFLDIDNIEITEMIIRPSVESTCISVDFTSPVIPNNGILTLPHRIVSIQDNRMNLVQGGIYAISPFYLPPIKKESAVVGNLIHGCAQGGGYWDWFSLNPPVVATAVDVFLTRMVVHFEGISVTVYDAAGNVKRTTFPDMVLVFSSDAEEAGGTIDLGG
jgi:hypothetical protein